MSEIDWRKVVIGLRAEADRLAAQAEVTPKLELARMSGPAIVVLWSIATAIEQALIP